MCGILKATIPFASSSEDRPNLNIEVGIMLSRGPNREDQMERITIGKLPSPAPAPDDRGFFLDQDF